MTNKIDNTPIWVDSYVHLGFNSLGAQNKNCVVLPNGYLYSAFWHSNAGFLIYKSEDNGFSWTRVMAESSAKQDAYPLNTMGARIGLTIDEEEDSMVVLQPYYQAAAETDLYLYEYAFGVPAAETITYTIADIYQGAYDFCQNKDNVFITYVLNDGNNKISIRRFSHRTWQYSAAATLNVTPVYNVQSICCDKNNRVSLLFCHQTGGHDIVKYASYDPEAGWRTPVTISDLGSTTPVVVDPGIALDGYGHLCAFWGQDNGSNVITNKYSISLDNGATWSAVASLSMSSGHTSFMDDMTNSAYSMNSIIGDAQGGWIITYAETYNSLGKTYVRRLTTADAGATYTLGSEKEIATGSQYTGEIIAGAHFFLPSPHSRLMDLSDPGLLRVGFRVGDSSDTDGTDDTPVDFCQERLFVSAYPSVLTSDSTEYTMETATADSILVTLEVLPGASENVDYYTLGLTGEYTTRYIDAFKSIGNSFSLLKYEPDADNYMNDRSAYGDPSESVSLAILSPQTYDFPTPEITAGDITGWMEQDVRKIYLPPTAPLLRTFLVNKGGFLKRTVWTTKFDGNEYEITQVIPYFINNQICYYGANCYVIGPSRDPFAKTVLPSET